MKITNIQAMKPKRNSNNSILLYRRKMSEIVKKIDSRTLQFKMPVMTALKWFSINHSERIIKEYTSEKFIPKGLHSLLRNMIIDNYEKANETYNELIELDVDPELARCVLPQGLYVIFTEKEDSSFYMKLCSQYLNSDEKDLRQYSLEVLRVLFPCCSYTSNSDQPSSC